MYAPLALEDSPIPAPEHPGEAVEPSGTFVAFPELPTPQLAVPAGVKCKAEIPLQGDVVKKESGDRNIDVNKRN